MQETGFQSLGQEDPLEKGMATHSSILAWRSPWTEEPGGLQSKAKVKSLSRVRLFAIQWTVAHQAPLSMDFSRQEYWSGLPFSSPGDLPDQGIEPRSPALQADSLLSWPPFFYYIPQYFFLVDLCVLYKTLLSILFFCKHPLSIFHPSFIVSLVEQKSLTFMIKTRVSHTRYKKKWPKRKDDQFSCKQEYKYIQ